MLSKLYDEEEQEKKLSQSLLHDYFYCRPLIKPENLQEMFVGGRPAAALVHSTSGVSPAWEELMRCVMTYVLLCTSVLNLFPVI